MDLADDLVHIVGGDQEFLVNTLSKKVHLLDAGTDPACGRRWPVHFGVVTERPTDPKLVCAHCLRARRRGL